MLWFIIWYAEIFKTILLSHENVIHTWFTWYSVTNLILMIMYIELSLESIMSHFEKSDQDCVCFTLYLMHHGNYACLQMVGVIIVLYKNIIFPNSGRVIILVNWKITIGLVVQVIIVLLQHIPGFKLF